MKVPPSHRNADHRQTEWDAYRVRSRDDSPGNISPTEDDDFQRENGRQPVSFDQWRGDPADFGNTGDFEPHTRRNYVADTEKEDGEEPDLCPDPPRGAWMTAYSREHLSLLRRGISW